MAEFKITQAQKELVEKLGVFYEKSGMQPAACRVMALLIVSDQTELTFEEILHTLGISKSATSGAINLLLTANRLEYITRPGDRKRYFRAKILNWKVDMLQNMSQMTSIGTLLKEINKQRPKASKEFNNILAEMISFLEFLNAEIPFLLKKWESKK
ncbi:MAG: MarR family transcriptional regulator [Cytophagaceae bacterium]|nr:MarR family transcriptional regulator [Cytophagaceae bacterium]